MRWASMIRHPLDKKEQLPHYTVKHHMLTTVACSRQSGQGGWETPGVLSPCLGLPAAHDPISTAFASVRADE